MNLFVQNGRMTPFGVRLWRAMDDCLRRKSGMTPELRHYSTLVYRARLLKPQEWMEQHPDKAEALWAHFFPDEDDAE